VAKKEDCDLHEHF